MLFAVTYGVSSNEQEGIVKSFMKNIYKVDVEQLLTAGKWTWNPIFVNS